MSGPDDMNTDVSTPPEWGTMTHKALVRRMVLWLRNSRGYSVVIAERSTAANETPDVLGFHGAKSLLIECKVSRADFLADKEKRFRISTDRGMGDLRYFAAPAGMLTGDDMPPDWGFLEVRDRQVREILAAMPQQANKRSEVTFLVSAIRRLEIACTVFVRQESELAE